MTIECWFEPHGVLYIIIPLNVSNGKSDIAVSLYSRTSLSRTRFFRNTAYLEVKIWSLFLHETITRGNKIMWKRGEIAHKEQFLLFSTLLYIYISHFRSQITYSLVKCGCSISIYCFPQFLNSDMSRYGYLEVFQ